MASDVIETLEAAQIIFRGLAPDDVTALQNVYVWPDEYATVGNNPTVPFMTIGEQVGVQNSIGNLPTGNSNRGIHRWNMELVLYLTYGENQWPSSGAATAELQQRNWAIAINDLLARNRTLSGTVFSIGEQRPGGFILADYLIDHEQWDQMPYWAIRFLIPVVQIYDRGG